jgi:tripartite-type tricarboxylate transporter receptor subunit TctC
MRKWILAAAGLIAFGLSGAAAQTYPSRNITMVIPFAAGGPTDTIGRLVAEAMSKSLGQTVVIENVVGAGGTRGSAQVAKAKPDGYTLLLHHVGMSTAPTLYRKPPFNSLTDFRPSAGNRPMTSYAVNFPARISAKCSPSSGRTRTRCRTPMPASARPRIFEVCS